MQGKHTFSESREQYFSLFLFLRRLIPITAEREGKIARCNFYRAQQFCRAVGKQGGEKCVQRCIVISEKLLRREKNKVFLLGA